MTGEATAASGIGALEIATQSGAVIVRARPIAQPEVLRGSAEIQRRRRGPHGRQQPGRDRLPRGHRRHHRLDLRSDRVPRSIGPGGDHRAVGPHLGRAGSVHRRASELRSGDHRAMRRALPRGGSERHRRDRGGRRRRRDHHLGPSRGRRPCGDAQVHSASGRVVLGLTRSGSVDVRTVSGRVAVAVPAGVDPALHLVSRSGRVRSRGGVGYRRPDRHRVVQRLDQGHAGLTVADRATTSARGCVRVLGSRRLHRLHGGAR